MNYTAAPAAAADNVFYDSRRRGTKMHSTAHLGHIAFHTQHFKNGSIGCRGNFIIFVYFL